MIYEQIQYIYHIFEVCILCLKTLYNRFRLHLVLSTIIRLAMFYTGNRTAVQFHEKKQNYDYLVNPAQVYVAIHCPRTIYEYVPVQGTHHTVQLSTVT